MLSRHSSSVLSTSVQRGFALDDKILLGRVRVHSNIEAIQRSANMADADRLAPQSCRMR
jgi:hypothetical protein